MVTVFRESPFGQCVRFLSGRRWMRYPEEQPGFMLPTTLDATPATKSISNTNSKDGNTSTSAPGATSDQSEKSQEDTVQKQDNIIVDWYSDQDPANPQNWSSGKKSWVAFVIVIYTFGTYLGSSVYSASVPAVVEIFGVSHVAASLGLALYVVGYGIGPLIPSPLSEIPVVGRNPPYIISFTIFVILCVPTALVNNFGGLLVLRLLLGFFCSPSLATGGASMGDIFSPEHMPYAIALWSGVATLGPALGPIVGSFAVQAENWRWSSWELLWLCGPIWILMFFGLPETSSDLILLQRARRLRKVTGRREIFARSELRQANFSPRKIAFDALIKPVEINAKDPAVLFSTLYMALLYGTYYSFFESFPIVYGEGCGWGLGVQSLAFLGILAGNAIAVVGYCAYFYFIGDKRIAAIQAEKGGVPIESRLTPGLFATFLLPAGLFIFAWTARPSIHWFPSILGVAISNIGVYVLVQSIFMYLAFAYPTYSGSLFAANAFARGSFAAAAVLFSTPMFRTLGIGGGVSLLGGLAVACCFGMYGMYFYGPALRKRSKFATS